MQILQPTPQAVYTGVLNAISKISTTEGAKTLWRGVNSVIVGAGPAHALYFGTYEYAKHAFGGNESGHHPFAAGKNRQDLGGNFYFHATCIGRRDVDNHVLVRPITFISAHPRFHSTYSHYSCRWSLCHHLQRCSDESI